MELIKMDSIDYKHYISLGFFCSVALELERIGLRETSSPFDWLIADFEGVTRAIDSHFKNWLNYDNLLQNKDYHEQYKDVYYKCQFFHDFNKMEPLEKQLIGVQRKYKRRIDRFYKMIEEPTLFLRYINDKKTDDGRNEELLYIEKNYAEIIESIKSFNSNNDIIFIANTGVTSNIITIYNVEKDKGDVVAREFLEKNEELKKKLCDCNYEKRQMNLKIYRKKKKREKIDEFLKTFNNFANTKKKDSGEYIHDKQYASTVIYNDRKGNEK